MQQMRNEAIDMLVLWAASKEYSAVSVLGTAERAVGQVRHTAHPSRLPCVPLLQEIETVLKHWAATFEITDTELNDRIMAAATGQLTRPCSASANVRTPSAHSHS